MPVALTAHSLRISVSVYQLLFPLFPLVAASAIICAPDAVTKLGLKQHIYSEKLLLTCQGRFGPHPKVRQTQKEPFLTAEAPTRLASVALVFRIFEDNAKSCYTIVPHQLYKDQYEVV